MFFLFTYPPRKDKITHGPHNNHTWKIQPAFNNTSCHLAWTLLLYTHTHTQIRRDTRDKHTISDYSNTNCDTRGAITPHALANMSWNAYARVRRRCHLGLRGDGVNGEDDGRGNDDDHCTSGRGGGGQGWWWGRGRGRGTTRLQ